MSAGKGNVSITLKYKGNSYAIRTHINEYYSLMTLIVDHLGISGFGSCCGIGSCGTCLVELCDQYTTVNQPVLACDIKINDTLSNTQITISEQRY